MKTPLALCAARLILLLGHGLGRSGIVLPRALKGVSLKLAADSRLLALWGERSWQQCHTFVHVQCFVSSWPPQGHSQRSALVRSLFFQYTDGCELHFLCLDEWNYPLIQCRSKTEGRVVNCGVVLHLDLKTCFWDLESLGQETSLCLWVVRGTIGILGLK